MSTVTVSESTSIIFPTAEDASETNVTVSESVMYAVFKRSVTATSPLFPSTKAPLLTFTMTAPSVPPTLVTYT